MGSEAGGPPPWAGSGEAHPALGVGAVLVAEPIHRGEHRSRREGFEAAEGRVRDLRRQLPEEHQVVGTRRGSEDPIQALDQAPGADPAGNGLAAGLAGGEVEQESCRGDHARRRVGDEHRLEPMCPPAAASASYA